MANVMVDIKNVSQNFVSAGEVIPAVKEANFQIEENSFNIIYGASGSGKSTLLNVLSGLQTQPRRSTGWRKRYLPVAS
jgi:putative ABC transport system ATP-binding protein